MSATDLILDPEWDAPFFKVLANNDTGQAAGHQAGVVIPKDLRDFFPTLTGAPTASEPTVSTKIAAHLFEESHFLDIVTTRYQFQTWGNTRPAESRLTDNLSQLRNHAYAGDVLLFQRHAESLREYRLMLVHNGSAFHAEIRDAIAGRRWGLLNPTSVPLSETSLERAENDEAVRETRPFLLFDESARATESRQVRIARSAAFRLRIQQLYGYTCAICGECLQTPYGMFEVEAAHIVPRHKRGADDARNGIGLCKRHHWAFDRGLFGIRRDRTIHVPPSVQAIRANAPLSVFMGRRLQTPVDLALAPHDEALHWHWTNVMLASD
jgi:putative restriction endonuclease